MNKVEELPVPPAPEGPDQPDTDPAPPAEEEEIRNIIKDPDFTAIDPYRLDIIDRWYPR